MKVLVSAVYDKWTLCIKNYSSSFFASTKSNFVPCEFYTISQ